MPNPRSYDADRLIYQVTFWQRDIEPGEEPSEDDGFLSDVWQMPDTDVREVLDWAEKRAESGQTFQVHVAVLDPNSGRGLLCLYGENPVPSVRG